MEEFHQRKRALEQEGFLNGHLDNGQYKYIRDLLALQSCRGRIQSSSAPEGSLKTPDNAWVYTSVDHLATLIGAGGLPTCFMVKADVKEAYRMVPVHPEDRPLLGLARHGWIWCYPLG